MARGRWGPADRFAIRNTSPRSRQWLPFDPARRASEALRVVGQGSLLLARGGLVDLERLALAYELFQTTSPSVAILASLDATRRDHATDGEKICDEILDMAEEAREQIAKIASLLVLDRDRLDGDGAYDLDRSKILIDVARLGVAGHAIDDWLAEQHAVSVGLSDALHLLVVVSAGTQRSDIRRLVRALRDLIRTLRRSPEVLPAAPPAIPPIGALRFDLAMPLADAFFAPAEKVPYQAAAGRICAEVIAPAPPGIPRLVPGQRISAEHAKWLTANRNSGMFVLDPADPAEHSIRVVADG